jgi:hypothetical protein
MKKVVAFVLALALAFPASGLLAPTPAHATDYKVSFGQCYSMSYSVANGQNATFVLPAHNGKTVQIITANSWTWKRDARGFTMPSAAYNQYHIKFLDANKRVVWQEASAIPNGGARNFWVGSNVRYIVVTANATYTSPSGAKYAWAVQPKVGFSSW